MSGRYILDKNGKPKPEPDLMKWARWIESEKGIRIVKQEDIDDIKVSTVFLGLNHNFCGTGAPILWETMIFCSGKYKDHKMDQEQDRCSGTRKQALAMHEEMCARVRSEILQESKKP